MKVFNLPVGSVKQQIMSISCSTCSHRTTDCFDDRLLTMMTDTRFHQVTNNDDRYEISL